jgi:hypothetical protein
MKDLQGCAYTRVAELRNGLRVQVDGDFTCIPANAIRVVKSNEHGFFISCREGGHQLDGQESDDGTYLIGIYNA